MAPGAMSRTFASSAGEANTVNLDTRVSFAQLAAVVCGAVFTGGYALHTVDAKLATVDEKMAGLEKTLDAKMAGVEKGVDAKVAGVKDTAKAEALIIMKDYGVSPNLLERGVAFGLTASARTLLYTLFPLCPILFPILCRSPSLAARPARFRLVGGQALVVPYYLFDFVGATSCAQVCTLLYALLS